MCRNKVAPSKLVRPRLLMRDCVFLPRMAACLCHHRLLLADLRLSQVDPEPPSSYKLQSRHSASGKAKASNGLEVAAAATFRTWVQIIVVLTSECPSNSCTVRMSVPYCSRYPPLVRQHGWKTFDFRCSMSRGCRKPCHFTNMRTQCT